MSDARSETKVGAAVGPWLVLAVVLAVVLSPMARPVMDDDFPLSTYPMFVEARTKAKLYRAFGVSAAGRQVLGAQLVVGDVEEPMAAAMALQRAAGRRKLRGPLCEETARRVAADAELEGVGEVELVVETWAPIDFYARPEGEAAPLSSRVFARCEVPGLEAGAAGGEEPEGAGR